MPRAVLGAQSVPEAALSVTEVSKRLGVSASTLRTWERRYGVGPEERAAGAHRRYLPDDVERLRAMIGLVRSGMPTGQAAAAV
ncbi:transcriptional regulator, MerR family, partial [Schaalia georgiae F0490]